MYCRLLGNQLKPTYYRRGMSKEGLRGEEPFIFRVTHLAMARIMVKDLGVDHKDMIKSSKHFLYLPCMANYHCQYYMYFSTINESLNSPYSSPLCASRSVLSTDIFILQIFIDIYFTLISFNTLFGSLYFS